MRSPFRIFRKHQKEATVILIGLAMFAFVILDSLTRITEVPPQLWIVLLAVALGGVFWVIGVQSGHGKQKEYSLAGALLGAALGFLLMAFNRPAPAVETSAGNISHKELEQMIARRQKAIQFMQEAYQAAVPPPPAPPQWARRDLVMRLAQNELQRQGRLSPFTRMLLQQHENYERWARGRVIASFGFTPEQPVTERDVVRKYLLLKEAKKYGIRVSDEAVATYIKRMTNGNLTTDIYNRIRDDRVHLSEDELFDILREEITARLMLSLRLPPKLRIPTLGDYWDQYRKLHVRQRLEFTEVPIKPFVEKIAAAGPQPPEKELRELYDKYKERVPTGEPSPEPAFGLPERIQIAYFSADYSKVENEVIRQLESDFLTEEERTAALKKIDEAMAAFEQKLAEGKIKPEDVLKERLKAYQPYLRRLLKAGGKINRLEYEIVKHYEERKDPLYADPAWRARQEARKKAEEAARRDPRQHGPVEAPRPKTPPAKRSGPNGEAVPGDSGAARHFPSVLLPDSNAERSSAPATAAAAAVTFPALSLLPADSRQPGTAKPPIKKTSKKTSTKADGTNAGGTRPGGAAQPKSATGELHSPPPPPMPYFPIEQTARPPVSAPRPVLPFQPLDEKLRSTIRDEVLKRRTEDEIRKRLNQAAAEMRKYSEAYVRSLEGEEEFDSEAASRHLEATARKLGLKYVVTGLFSQLEFGRDATRFPMNNAVETDEKFERPTQRPLFQILFPQPSSRDRSDEKNRHAFELYRIIRVRGFSQEQNAAPQFFVLWKTIHKEAEVPPFDDPETRKKVVQAWREIQARKQAEQRAKELADKLRTARKPMRDAFAGLTVTGEAGGDPLRSELFPPRGGRQPGFSWLMVMGQNLSVPATGIPPGGQIVPTPIPGIDKPDDNFRNYIFNELQDGEIGVVPNADHSKYYVVRVVDRYPVTPEGLRDLMKTFLGEENVFDTQPGRPSLYNDLNSPFSRENQQLWQKAEQQLFEEYNVRFFTRLNS